MKMNREVFLTSELVFKEDSGERFYHEFGNEIVPNWNDENKLNINEVIPSNLTAWFSNEVDMIPIDIMKKLVNKAEKVGSNYISIFYHGDHQEYEVMGWNLREESEDEKNIRIEKERENFEKQKSEAKIRLLSYAAEYGLKIKIENE